MPERVNSLAPIILSLIFVFVATMAVELCSPVRAESTCIEQPTQPAAEGTRWSARYDRAKGRKCWFLLDANGYDVTPSQTQPSAVPTPAPSLSSQIVSLLGSLTGAIANAVPQANTAQSDAAPISPAGVPRKHDGNAANANKNDTGGQADQRSVGEGRAVKRASPPLTQPEREALFEEFLRWQENRQSAGTLSPWPSSR
jgi:hypothetical protein